MNPRGRLFLVPAPLDFGCDEPSNLQEVLPQGTLAAAAKLQHWVCENAKSARAYLKRIDAAVPLCVPLQQMNIQELPHAVHKKGDHRGEYDARPLLAPVLAGHDMGLLSEAGMPAIADPGSSVVRAAHDLGVLVTPLVGPVSVLLALAASGLNGQHFAFVGYLPQDASQRQARLRELEGSAHSSGQSQIFIETPYRNPALWQALMTHLKGHTRVCVASGLTLPSAHIECHDVQTWRQKNTSPPKDVPTVFALGV